MKYRFVKDLEQHLSATFNASSCEVEPELCPTEFEGDLTINCFRLAASLRRNPIQIAACACDYLSTHPSVAAAASIKAFVNVSLRPTALFADAVGDDAALLAACELPEAERKRVLIEFSAPNTNKPQHLGHVRNNTLGMAMSSILGRVGHTIIPINLVNDRGIHICKSMVAYRRWGNGSTPESSGCKGDHFVGDYYVRYDKMLKQETAALREQRPDLAERAIE